LDKKVKEKIYLSRIEAVRKKEVNNWHKVHTLGKF